MHKKVTYICKCIHNILCPKHVQSFQMLVNKYRKRYFCHGNTSVPKFENLDTAGHKTIAPIY